MSYPRSLFKPFCEMSIERWISNLADSIATCGNALFTAEGVATLEGVQVAAATAGGTHTLRIVDATPGRYGDLGRCAEARVVVDVEALPEPEEPEGEEAAPEAEGGGGEEE